MLNNFHILLLKGPNLNLLGVHELDKYRCTNLTEIIADLIKKNNNSEIKFNHFQSNAEYELIENIYQAQSSIDFIIINPSALFHTSMALRDALLSVDIPFIEVHISNTYARESFQHSFHLSNIAIGVICGIRPEGYYFALQATINYY